MKTILATTMSTLAFLGLSMSAHALTQTVPVNDTIMVVQEAALNRTEMPNTLKQAPVFNAEATIGIARLDKGRLIAAPIRELRDWAGLNTRTEQNFAIISPAALLSNIPEVPMDGHGSVNQLDEIRMTASDLRMEYMVVYGMGEDAQWGSFARKPMMETGFIVDNETVSPRANAKALLVNTYTGEIYGTITSDDTEFDINDLTQKVQALIKDLSAVPETTEV